MKSFTERVAYLKAEGAYQVMARSQMLEAEGRDIIHLEIGEPDFPTPDHIKKAGTEAIQAGFTRYNSPSGIPQLREFIAEDAGAQRNTHIFPEQVIVSPGAKPNLFFPTLALVSPGDEVIHPDPGFPTYEAMIRVAGGIPVAVPLAEENGFSFELNAYDQLINDRTKLVILNSPGNPTGSVISSADLQHIAKKTIQHNCWVMSDEIYARIAFDGIKIPSIYALPGMAERTIIVDGFSKTYSMTGWRLGYGIMPKILAERVNLLFTHSIGCTAHFTQHAGIAALRSSQDCVNEMVTAYQQRRDAIVTGLNLMPGVTCLPPKGAFYAFPNVKSFGISSTELANLILDKANVSVLPGTAFGKHGEGYLRMVFANSITNINRALERLGNLFASLPLSA